jgi:hypothetical protein
LKKKKSFRKKLKLIRNFKKGPIPWEWLTRAAKLSGKSLHLAVIIWFISGIKRNKTIPLSCKVARDFGIQRNSVYRALQCLEDEVLVQVERKQGKNSIITIVQ